MRITEFPVLAEIKDEYKKHRQLGIGRNQAVTELLKIYHNEVSTETEDDSFLFWIGLADAQYSLKELSGDVAKRGLHAIKMIETSDLPIALADLSKRKEWYSAAPMPERSKVTKSKKFRCSWQMGDTFAYKLLGPDAEECGLNERYVLFRKVDELEFGDGRLLPVVTVTMWDERVLPQNAEEFARLPILKLAHGRLGLSSSLFEYRVELLIRSQKELRNLALEYLGNFTDVSMPNDEVIIKDAGMITMVSPQRLTRKCCIFWKHHNQNK